MDRLSEMEAFAAVVDQGGFTGAAQKLGVSKSAVSKYVSSLEGRLGVRLLNRTTRRVNPTDIGLLYYDRARNVLSAALEADTAVSSLQSAPTGLLRVLAPYDYGTHVLAPLVSQFLHRFPDVDIAVTLSDRPADYLGEAADVTLRLGQRPDGTLKADRLDSFQRYLVASPAYLDQYGAPERIEAVGQHRLIHTAPAGTDPCWHLVSSSGEHRTVRTGGRVLVNSDRAALEHAIAGLGIAFLPEFVVGDALAAGQVRLAMPDLPPQTLPLFAVYTAERAVLPRVRAFLECLGPAAEPAAPVTRAAAAS